MKTIIIMALSCQLLLQGCGSDSVLTREERERMRPNRDEKVRFVLHDGRTIVADPHHHIRVTEPSDFVFVFGEEHMPKVNSSGESSAIISAEAFDSACSLRGSPGTPADGTLLCWLSDSTCIRFEYRNAVRITPEDGTGYWCIGKVENRNEEIPMIGKIPYDEIEEIIVVDTSIPVSTSIIVGILTVWLAVSAATGALDLSGIGGHL